MWEKLIEMAARDGIWAVLFCLLFIFELRDSRRREHKYQDSVAKLSTALGVVSEVKQKCESIKEDVSMLVVQSQVRKVKDERVKKSTSTDKKKVRGVGKKRSTLEKVRMAREIGRMRITRGGCNSFIGMEEVCNELP